MSEGVGQETHSIEVAPPHDGDPDALRRAAQQLQRCAADVDVVVSVTMRAWGTQLGYAASLTLPRLALSPVGAGAIGAAGTAAMGDTEPSDLIQAFAMSYLEDAAGRRSDGEPGGNLEAAAVAPSRAVVVPRVDELVRSADQLDPAGGGVLTYAGRGVAKHGGRPGSVFPRVRGGPALFNAEGRRIVDEILHDPAATITTRFAPRYGHYMDIRSRRGMGIRYAASGRFIGFLEP